MEAFCSTFLQSLSQRLVRFRKENIAKTVQLAGVGNMYIMENYLCAVKNKSFHVRRPVLQLDPVFLRENNLSYENIPWPGHLEVAEVKLTTLVMRTHLSLQKVSVCLRATETLLVWALSRGEDFDFVFKNIGVLVCRERKVTMRFYEDFLKEVDETGNLSKSFLRNPELRPLIIAHTELAVFQMPPGGVFVFPQFIRKNAGTEEALSEQAERKGDLTSKRLLSRPRLSATLTNDAHEMKGSLPSVSVLPPVRRSTVQQGDPAEKKVPEARLPVGNRQLRDGARPTAEAPRPKIYRVSQHGRIEAESKKPWGQPVPLSVVTLCLPQVEQQQRAVPRQEMSHQMNLPTNFRNDDLKGIHKDGMKIGASMLDATSMPIDTAVRFDGVGGLSEHIAALKEMVILPLLYPEVFEKLQVQPPRGCLFYGPPGTGKTLVARALANECSQGARKISFFLRKGADALSKWVGESERQLRLLFDQAHQSRPSIIFFDEIDGLAPVRSSGQDQTYSSIVSTLLALMDGLDSRGEVVVIGATNRLDSIDPALRRPGRFDREFLFGLPDKEARKEIFKIHTRNWTPKPLDTLLEELAEKSVGYCGADIKAACAEAALRALRRRYPQIYKSTEKLQLDASSIKITAKDFVMAMEKMVPASQRSVSSPAQALSPILKPLLKKTLKRILQALQRVFPHAELVLKKDQEQPTSHRPRLLLSGEPDSGQCSHLAPAVLHALEKFPVYSLDLSVLFPSASTPEETCAQFMRDAQRTAPSIIYIPQINVWWESAGVALKTAFMTLLEKIPPFAPVLLFATSNVPYMDLQDEVQELFIEDYGEVFHTRLPTKEERRNFFEDLILNQAAKPPVSRKEAAWQALEVLPLAPPPEPRKLTQEEMQQIEEQEEDSLRELRIFLRDVTHRLTTDRRFKAFTKPVDLDEVPDYTTVIKQPMDLSTITSKIDLHQYITAGDFLKDIDLICSNALEYNPDREPGDRLIRHRACSLRDVAYAIVKAEMDEQLEQVCKEIKEARKKRVPTRATG
ncbi:ATPase family AAA domain-containing protein 2-like [Eudromia elegans]